VANYKLTPTIIYTSKIHHKLKLQESIIKESYTQIPIKTIKIKHQSNNIAKAPKFPSKTLDLNPSRILTNQHDFKVSTQ
jgi:hypothetical protein